MLRQPDFQVKFNQKEILPINSLTVPFACFHDDMDSQVEHCFPWHWHPLLEINYVLSGEMEFRTPECVCCLNPGQLIFLNSGVMHAVSSKAHMPGCAAYSLLFEPQFLSGAHSVVLEQNYLLPILNCSALSAYVIVPDSLEHIRMVEAFLSLVELCREEPFGYEFEVRTQLSRFWCALLQETEELRAGSVRQDSRDTERLKAMLTFIQEHYMERLTLEEIAASASVSGRECSRCFRRGIRTSPMAYLNEYRVRMAAQQLLHTDESILAISEGCGFGSSSYFDRIFREKMGCTPRAYRNR